MMLYTGCMMKQHLKKYFVRMTAGFIVYVAGVCAAHYFHTKQSLHEYWPIFLFPIIPVIYIVAAIISFVSEGLDELQKKLSLKLRHFRESPPVLPASVIYLFKMRAHRLFVLSGGFT